MTTVAIIGALEEEVAHIADSLEDATHIAAASLDVVRGTLTAEDGGTINVAATVGGMGLVNAAATTQYLIDLCHPDAVIFSGIAGNLNKALHINDVVLGGTLRYLDTDMRLVGQWKPGTPDRQVAEFHSDPRLLAVAGAALERMGITHINGTPIKDVNTLNMITSAVQTIDGLYPDGRYVSYSIINNSGE